MFELDRLYFVATSSTDNFLYMIKADQEYPRASNSKISLKSDIYVQFHLNQIFMSNTQCMPLEK